MLNEAAEDDVRRSAIADNFLDAIIRYCYNSDRFRNQVTMGGGHSCPMLEYSDLTNTYGIWRDTMVVFFTHSTQFRGRAAKIHSSFDGGNIRYAIMIGVSGTTPKEIYADLCRDQIRETFRHEAQHVLDYKRRKMKAPEGDPIDDDQNIGISDLGKYYNSPAELNAYFHNLAEPLLARLTWMAKHGPDHIGLYDPLPPTFQEFLARRLKQIYGNKKSFWEHLTDENKRKVISRMSKLFSLVGETIAAHEKRDKYTQTSEEN